MTISATLFQLLPLVLPAYFIACVIKAIVTKPDAATRRAAPAQNLPDAMELERLRQQEAAAARLAAELRRIINSPQAVCLPLEDTGSARRALANWDKTKREAQA